MSEWSKVILFGDSLTQKSFNVNEGCWGAILTHTLQRKSDVICRGFSGYNTKCCRILLPKLFDEQCVKSVSCFVIFLGANDASLAGHKQHVPLIEYSDNLTCMINYLIGIGITKDKLVLVTPPPYYYDDHKEYTIRQGQPLPDRSNESVKEYAKACSNVGSTLNIEVLNVFDPFSQHPFGSKLFVDGLHFSVNGGEYFYELIWPKIEKRVAKFSSIKMKFPDWKVLNFDNLEESLDE